MTEADLKRDAELDSWQFTVPGIAQPQGSTRSFRHPKTGATITTSDNPKVRPWRQAIAFEARATGCVVLDGPVALHAVVYLPRPKGHHGKRGILASAPKRPAVRPDADKLLRALLDALTGICFRDDGQVVTTSITKLYADTEPPGMSVLVNSLVGDR